MSRYDDETYLPWYRRPTPTWLELSAKARGALVSISMELNNKTGEVTLRRGLQSLSTLVQIPWEDLEPALAELIAKGKLEWDGSRFVLRDPEYLDRKRPTSKERTQTYRDRKAAAKNDSEPEPELVTGVVTRVTSRDDGDVTSILFSSPSLSGSGSEIASGPPAWWQSTLDTVEMATGERLPAAEAWLRYEGHRDGKGIAPKPKDAQYWLTTVMVAERRKARDDAHHREKRDADFDRNRRNAKDPPPMSPVSREQAREDAKRFAAAILGRKVGT